VNDRQPRYDTQAVKTTSGHPQEGKVRVLGCRRLGLAKATAVRRQRRPPHAIKWFALEYQNPKMVRHFAGGCTSHLGKGVEDGAGTRTLSAFRIVRSVGGEIHRGCPSCGRKGGPGKCSQRKGKQLMECFALCVPVPHSLRFLR
jgi:hypothetical protein